MVAPEPDLRAAGGGCPVDVGGYGDGASAGYAGWIDDECIEAERGPVGVQHSRRESRVPLLFGEVGPPGIRLVRAADTEGERVRLTDSAEHVSIPVPSAPPGRGVG